MKANAKKILKRIDNDVDAVSPIVATLMLVLVAAGGAAGVWLWMGGFQEDATRNVATPDDTVLLTIGGSSTVWEFSNAAIPGFEAQHPNIQVKLESGGSGAGRKAACIGTVDIGSSSSPVKESDFDTCPDLDRDGKKDFGIELQVFKVATDAVVFATLPTNTHCDSIQLTQAQALEIYIKNAGSQGSYTGTITPGNEFTATGVPVTWASLQRITAANEAADTAHTDGNTIQDVIDAWTAAYDPACTVTTQDTLTLTDFNGAVATDTCDAAAAGGDPCDHTPPTASASTNEVIIFDRKDPGGTSEIASEKLFGQKQNQLEDFGVTLPDSQQGDGNQGVLDQVEDHANKDDALFFTSFGYANDQSLDVHSFGTTASSVLAPSSSNIKDESYDATRPILYITAGSPSPIEQLWIDYVMGSHTNQEINEAVSFESIY